MKLKTLIMLLLQFALVPALSLPAPDLGNESQVNIVIKGGRIVDGTGNPWYAADIGISGDRIVKIGRIRVDQGELVIDASGKIVSPGFIDMHSHGDFIILDHPSAQNLIMQGMTTLVCGNCGGSPIDVEDFFKKFESRGASVNIGLLYGHNTIRSKVLGNADRAPSPEELSEMKSMVKKAMKAGALGLSTGLKYRPGTYSSTDEIIALCRVAAEYGGFYATHLRDEGLNLFEAMEEAFEIGEKAGIPVQLSHHKATGADMWGESVRSLKMMEEARQRGLDVTTDQHPYPATYTTCTILFPPWALAGDSKAIRKRLKDPLMREKIVEGIVTNIIHDRGGNDIRNITIAAFSSNKGYEGKNLHEICMLEGIEPTFEHAAELLIQMVEKGGASCIFHCLSMDDVVRIMQHPLTMHASDAGIAIYGQGIVHPRYYGHFPRILALHVRERGDLRLEESVKKMTSLPARRIGAHGRGLITEGKFADIVIFDLLKIQDKATFANPHQYPEGIEYVIVNGKIVVDHGRITDERPGRIIYGPGKRE